MSTPGQPERVTRLPPDPEQQPSPTTWWGRYEATLAASGLSPTARSVIEADSRYIVDKGIFGDGLPGQPGWPQGRVRRGIVMGAVQSGKTASMLGVAALGLDAGVNMVVVLAGTRVSLWRQSLSRLLAQLDQADAEPVTLRNQRRLLVPDPLLAGDDESRSPSRLYTLNGPRVRRALARQMPIVAVVLKNVHHLRALADVMRQRVLPAVETTGSSFHLLVLDDEADDGSVLDARIERRLDPAFDDLKQIPRAIVDLWGTRPYAGATASGLLHATYVGYTATPQANFLQSDHNPLAPTEFAIALRTPFDRGDVEQRDTRYHEPRGLDAYYTGGESYYHRLRGRGLYRVTSGRADEDLGRALRAFFVAGAVRLLREPHRLQPLDARERAFAARSEVTTHAPRPSSMLFHPSAVIDDHFAAAAAVVRVACGFDALSSQQRIASGQRDLPRDAVQQVMDSEEDLWLEALADYRASAAAVELAFDLAHPRFVPTASDWSEIRQLILEQLVPVARIKIINSDSRADEPPAFEPAQDEGGIWRAPADLCTIFVSGNVMSRGLTLEGLTTSLFLRSSEDPFADTQMQMQRWFGYRGAHLELCRVFLPEEQLELFQAYHDADEALRRTVVARMRDEPDVAPAPVVLQGRDFTATGKLTNLANVPLCPGPAPFVRLVNPADRPDPNIELIARTFKHRPSSDVVVNDSVRGRVLDRPVPLAEAADLLDQLRYRHYRPTADGWEGSRWIDLESKVGIDRSDDREGLLPFFRPPEVLAADATPYARGGPYAIAAYLRLWKACLSRSARGLVATDDDRIPWSMLDLTRRSEQQPRFYVGIRYGSGSVVTDGPLGDLDFGVRTMQRAVSGGQLEGSWGTRNPGAGPHAYLGDELFDYHVHRAARPPATGEGGSAWRPVGAPGLILLHVIEQPGSTHPTAAVGVAIPIGGPDQFAARL